MGNKPTFEQPIRFGTPNTFSPLFYKHLQEILGTIQFTNNGPKLREFEDQICNTVNAKRCVATSNATVALQLLIKACNIPGKWAVPSFTFPATYQAIDWVGKQYAFYDVDENTHQMSSTFIHYFLAGALPVNLWGKLCNPIPFRERLSSEAKLIFDSAHAFGRRSGIIGDAEVFSFHATKFVNCGEGGAIVTNDDALADEVTALRNFGFRTGKMVSDVGTNAKMSEIPAALGLSYLRDMDSIINRNKEFYQMYVDGLTGIAGISVFDLGDNHPNYQYIVLQVEESLRDILWAALASENVETKRYFYPGHFVSQTDIKLPNTERLWRRTLCLPTGNSVSKDSINKICDLILDIVAAYRGGCFEKFKNV